MPVSRIYSARTVRLLQFRSADTDWLPLETGVNLYRCSVADLGHLLFPASVVGYKYRIMRAIHWSPRKYLENLLFTFSPSGLKQHGRTFPFPHHGYDDANRCITPDCLRPSFAASWSHSINSTILGIMLSFWVRYASNHIGGTGET
jgi:hypothetical protein